MDLTRIMEEEGRKRKIRLYAAALVGAMTFLGLALIIFLIWIGRLLTLI